VSHAVEESPAFVFVVAFAVAAVAFASAVAFAVAVVALATAVACPFVCHPVGICVYLCWFNQSITSGKALQKINPKSVAHFPAQKSGC
jgi:hypothetical protein